MRQTLCHDRGPGFPITVLPDYLDVKVHGAPSLHVLYQEVGLKESGVDRVGGGT